MSDEYTTGLTDDAGAVAATARVRPEPRLRSRRLRLPLPALLVAAVAGVILWGVHIHLQRAGLAAAALRETVDFRPAVLIAKAQRSQGPLEVSLPGATEAFQRTQIFAHATGYVAERRVDIGSRVRAGDLLARIAAPELDQQLHQAEATLGQREAELRQSVAGLDQARSNAELANVTNGRTAVLAKDGWETQQSADQTRLGLAAQNAGVVNAQAGIAVALANAQAQRATVQQLQELTAYEQVKAPFDGIVTVRNVEAGDLTTGTASGGTPMFVLEQDNVLRVHVDVPQADAVGLQDGVQATVRVPEMPERVFRGVVARNAGSLAAGSRTLAAEVDVDNAEHLLHPGLYVNVTLSLPHAAAGAVIPANAIVFNGEGLRVATVDAEGTVTMHDVAIYRDFGTTVELRSGLAGDETVVVNPPTGIHDGQKVRLPPHPDAGRRPAA